MGLRKAGKIRISKSGRALEIVDQHRVVEYRFYVPLEAVEAIINGKRSEADLSLLVDDSRENV